MTSLAAGFTHPDVEHIPTLLPEARERTHERRSPRAVPAPTEPVARPRSPGAQARLKRQRRSRVPSLRLVTNLLLGLALLAAAGWVGFILADPATLPLKTVRIEGRFTHVTHAELQRAIAPVALGGFFNVDVRAIRRAAQTLPWVQNASVRRVWPDTLYVAIEERGAVARWGKDGLLSSARQVFKPALKTFPPGLPELLGPENTHSFVLDQYAAITRTLAPFKLRPLVLELDARRAWRIELDNGIELVLGRTEAAARLHRFLRIYPQLAAQAPTLQRVDLRYSNGFTVRPSVTAPDTLIPAVLPSPSQRK